MANSAPWDVVVSPDARSLYASYAGSLNAVAEFDIGPDGTLTPKPGHETIAAGGGANNLAISPDGKNLYVANFSGDSIAQYDIGDGGVLCSKSSTTALRDGAGAFVVAPDGQTAYSANYTDGSVGFFTAQPTGLRSRDSPLHRLRRDERTPERPSGVPGRHEPVRAGRTDQVCQFDIAAGFARKAPADLGVAGPPWGVEIAPDGKHLYTPLTNDLVEQLAIGDGGFLAFMTPATVAAGALPRYAAVSPDGKQLYSTNESGPSVSQFDIASDGKLTAKTTASVAAGTSVSGIAVTPNQGPVATFSAAPGPPGATTEFDATSSSDPDGSVARYDWDFGDGTSLADGGAKPSHTYQSAGTYSVSLGLTDDVGCFERIYTGKTAVCNAPASALKKNVVVTSPPPGGRAERARRRSCPPRSRAALRGEHQAARPRCRWSRARGRAPPSATPCPRTPGWWSRSSVRCRPRVGRKCVRPTAKNRRKRKCTRYVRFGAFAVQSPAGANRHAFSGRIGRKRLKPGRHRAMLVATDAGGLASAPRRLNFKVVRR